MLFWSLRPVAICEPKLVAIFRPYPAGSGWKSSEGANIVGMSADSSQADTRPERRDDRRASERIKRATTATPGGADGVATSLEQLPTIGHLE